MAETNGKIALSWVLQLAAWGSAALLAYGMAQADIAVLQSKQNENERRLERIEMKVDELLRRP